jgi:hypothetical protein
MLSSILRKRYETTPLFSYFVCGRGQEWWDRPGRRTAEHAEKTLCPTIKYDALFLVKSSIVLQFGFRAEPVFHSALAGAFVPGPHRVQDGVSLHPDRF